MAGILTAVPDEPPPPPRGAARRLLPLADLFMVALLSRPRTGSLATSWVTRATLLLCSGCVAAALVLAVVLGAGTAPWPVFALAAALVLCIAFGAGAAAVVLVGVDQRRPVDDDA